MSDLLLDSILDEVRIIKYLGTKVPADQLDYRPTPEQRSTLELLQYLSCCGHRIAVVTLTGDMSLREQYGKESGEVTLDSFGAAMERQADRLRELIGETDLGRTVTLPWGEKTTAEGLFLKATLRFLTAYRMQLFLYLKGMGVEGMGTKQAWYGQD